MRSLPSGLTTALAQRAHALTRVCVITRRDGTVIRFTPGPDPVTIDGNAYVPALTLSLSAIRSRSDLGSTSCTLDVATADNGVIDLADLIAGRFDAADVVIMAADALTPSNGTVVLFTGRVADVIVDNTGKASLDLRGILYRDRSLAQQKFTPHCRADLGDARCKVDLTAFTKAGTVTSVVSEFVIEVTLDGGVYPADDYYNWGMLRWQTGENSGSMIEVRDWVQSTHRLTIMLPCTGIVAAGDTFLVTAGCDKALSTCFTRFANQLNFRGEPYVPVIQGSATDIRIQPGDDQAGGIRFQFDGPNPDEEEDDTDPASGAGTWNNGDTPEPPDPLPNVEGIMGFPGPTGGALSALDSFHKNSGFSETTFSGGAIQTWTVPEGFLPGVYRIWAVAEFGNNSTVNAVGDPVLAWASISYSVKRDGETLFTHNVTLAPIAVTGRAPTDVDIVPYGLVTVKPGDVFSFAGTATTVNSSASPTIYIDGAGFGLSAP